MSHKIELMLTRGLLVGRGEYWPMSPRRARRPRPRRPDPTWMREAPGNSDFAPNLLNRTRVETWRRHRGLLIGRGESSSELQLELAGEWRPLSRRRPWSEPDVVTRVRWARLLRRRRVA